MNLIQIKIELNLTEFTQLIMNTSVNLFVGQGHRCCNFGTLAVRTKNVLKSVKGCIFIRTRWVSRTSVKYGSLDGMNTSRGNFVT